MKLIIIVQTLIIIAGAYYVYLLSNPTEVVVEPAPPTPAPYVEPGTPRPGFTPPTSNPPIDPDIASSAVTGHNDVGMEFPTPDEEIQVR